MGSSSATHDRIALAGACLAALMFGLEISSVPVVLPTLERVLGADFNSLQWVMNAYTIAVTTVLMPTGVLADRYGRKHLFMLSIIAFGVASLVCGIANGVPLLIAARAFQGLSGGAMLICQIAVLSAQFQDPGSRGKAFGVWGIVFGFGLGFGPIIGGGIIALSGWQWVFLVHGPIALLTLLLVMGGVREASTGGAQRLDLVGIVALSVSVFSLTYYITQGAALGFANAGALAIAAVATISVPAFILVERLSPHAMFDFSIFRIRPFSGALLGSVGMNFSFWPFMIYFPIYLRSALGYDAVATGLALLAYTVPTLLVPPLAERLLLRYRAGIVIPAGMFTIGLGFILMKIGVAGRDPGWMTILPGSLIAGSGLGLTNTPVTNTTTGSVPSAKTGMASGIDMSARMIALAVNIAVMGLILTGGIRSALEQSATGSLRASILWKAAERIAAGDIASAKVMLSPTFMPGLDDAIHRSLARGFGSIMLYAGLSAWLLAVLSWLVFGRATEREAGGRPGV